MDWRENNGENDSVELRTPLQAVPRALSQPSIPTRRTPDILVSKIIAPRLYLSWPEEAVGANVTVSPGRGTLKAEYLRFRWSKIGIRVSFDLCRSTPKMANVRLCAQPAVTFSRSRGPRLLYRRWTPPASAPSSRRPRRQRFQRCCLCICRCSARRPWMKTHHSRRSLLIGTCPPPKSHSPLLCSWRSGPRSYQQTGSSARRQTKGI